jgi:uncharacterized protein (DUF2249 family)
MIVKINRTPSQPPKRDYSQRDTKKAAADRLRVFNALASLQIGHSLELTGSGVTRDRVNGLIISYQRQNTGAFQTAYIPGGIGIWRVL